MTLSSECERFIEEWLGRDSIDPPHIEGDESASHSHGEVSSRSDAPRSASRSDKVSTAHYRDCPGCREMVERLAVDREELVNHFGGFGVPEAPERLWADPLRSGSGYPRRISLNLMPFFFLLVLGAAILAVALTIYVLKEQRSTNPSGVDSAPASSEAGQNEDVPRTSK